MHRLHPALALIAFIALPMTLAADTPPKSTPPVPGSDDTRLIQVTRVEHANARELDNEVSKIFSVGLRPPAGPLVVVSDLDTNSLIFSGPQSLLTEAESLVRKLDVAPSGKTETQIVRLKHARAKELSAILREIISQQLATSHTGFVGIAFDERTESLILTGRPAALSGLHTLIDGLDIESRRPAE